MGSSSRRMDQPKGRSSPRFMDQSVVADAASYTCGPETHNEWPSLQRYSSSDFGMQRRLRLLLRAQGAASSVNGPVASVDEALAGPPGERAYRGVRDLLARRGGYDNGARLV